MLSQGSLLRATAATGMNCTGSRSHAIFTITLEQCRQVSSPTLECSILDCIRSSQPRRLDHHPRAAPPGKLSPPWHATGWNCVGSHSCAVFTTVLEKCRQVILPHPGALLDPASKVITLVEKRHWVTPPWSAIG